MSLEETNTQGTDPDAAVARLVEASFETLTDEMVGRLAKTASETLTLLDEFQSHRVTEALPILGEMVASGDLARLAHLARLVGAAEDALTDDLVVRLAAFASGGMTMLDRVNQADTDHYWRLWERLAEGLTPALMDRVVKVVPVVLDLLEQAQESGLLQDAMEGLLRTRKQLAALPRPAGGLAGLWAIMKDAENQRTLQALLLYGRQVLGADHKA
ncbi:MAG: hypothetical protein ACYDEV_08945 [Acidiferrobacter sp.]